MSSIHACLAITRTPYASCAAIDEIAFSQRVCGIAIPLLSIHLLRFSILFLHKPELIKECLIADLEDSGSLTAIPSRLQQYSFDVFPLRLHRGTTSNFEQRRTPNV